MPADRIPELWAHHRRPDSSRDGDSVRALDFIQLLKA